MGLRFIEFTELSDKLLDDIVQLEAAVFPEPFSKEKIERKLAVQSSIRGIIVYSEKQPVGFKVGFERSPIVFYSWIGGVHPEFRKQGIAKRLIRRQHQWCKEKDYEKVATSSRNSFREMMILNLQEGFDIVDTHLDSQKNEVVVIFEKSL